MSSVVSVTHLVRGLGARADGSREDKTNGWDADGHTDMLREQVAELKSFLKDKNAPFGVDLLLPQVGGGARKTK